MSKRKRYLITTADENTWKFDQPVIFLGEWCLLYERKHIWKGMDSIVAKSYGLGSLKKDIDYKYVKNLEEKLFPKLCSLLNNYNRVNHDERFWKIIVGHWFRATINMLINRINTLKQCFQTEEISETILYESDYCALTSPDISTALIYYNNDQWNNILYGRIMHLLNDTGISINYCTHKNRVFTYKGFKILNLNNNRSFKKIFIKWAQKVYSKFASKFVKDSDALIINTYLPKKEEIKLELKLKQWPQIWNTLNPKIYLEPDKNARKDLTKNFLHNATNDLEYIICDLLIELLPVYYLEGYKVFKKIVEKQPWPKSPKFIFTSNNFYKDEIFKFWTAFKIEKGTKYIVGQHGNNYYSKKNLFPRIEEITSDKFITWGWSNGLSKYVPAFIFKTAGKNIDFSNPKGGILLIETTQSIRLTTWDSTAEHNHYFDDQKIFINKLNLNPRNKLKIRLSALTNDRKYNEFSRWYDFDKNLKINDGSTPLRHLIAESRLIVHSYDSTGILETLSQNIPTLAFWQNNFDHLRDEVKSDYKILVDAGIIHLSARSAAEKVNEIWDNVEKWWSHRDVQNAKDLFCKIFAKKSKNPSKTLFCILNKE